MPLGLKVLRLGFDPINCKTQCQLGKGRVKQLCNKKGTQMRELRREVAELLRNNKHSSARIRVEAVIREHHMLEAFELLELYLELLAVRAELLAKTKEMPPDMVEAISSLIYAGERVTTELAEVNQVAKMLVSKFKAVYKQSGFPHEVVSDLTCRKWQVNDSLAACLAATAPPPERKLQFLEDIAAEHGVEFDWEAAARELLPAAPRAACVAPVQPPVVLDLVQDVRHDAASAAEQAPPTPAPGRRPPRPGAPAARQPATRSSSLIPAGEPGMSVFHRLGAVEPPGFTQTPGRGDHTGPATAWQPLQPEDMDRPGRAFQGHLAQVAVWRHVKVHDPSRPSASPGPSLTPSQNSANTPAMPTPAASPAHPPPAAASHDAMQPACRAAGTARPAWATSQQAEQRAEDFAASAARQHQGGGGCDAASSSSSRSLAGSPHSQAPCAHDAAPSPASKAAAQAPGPPSPLWAALGDISDYAASAGAATAGSDFESNRTQSMPAVHPPAASIPAVPPRLQLEPDDPLVKRFHRLRQR